MLGALILKPVRLWKIIIINSFGHGVMNKQNRWENRPHMGYYQRMRTSWSSYFPTDIYRKS
jgi:hypothetical protein